MNEEFLFVEKYRPHTVADTILPETTKKIFEKFVKQKNIPNLILTGTAGVGKTTIARAMLEELDCDYIIINGSMNGNIDTLRNDIQQFASSVSFTGGRKYVILDEADYLNPTSTQPALRNFMEEYSRNCGFILTCNFKNRIIEPLHSRCSVIEFKIDKKDKPKIAAEMFKRVCGILNTEEIQYDKKVVAEVVQKYFPDNRKILNELQKYAASGQIDTGILANVSNVQIEELVTSLKEKNFTEVRKWVAKNNDIAPTEIFRQIYDESSKYVKPSSIPQLVLILADYSYKAGFVADAEINMVACLTEIMIETEFA